METFKVSFFEQYNGLSFLVWNKVYSTIRREHNIRKDWLLVLFGFAYLQHIDKEMKGLSLQLLTGFFPQQVHECINALISLGYITRVKVGYYSLTPDGMNFINITVFNKVQDVIDEVNIGIGFFEKEYRK